MIVHHPTLDLEVVVGICGFISFASSTVNNTLCKAILNDDKAKQ
jgi:hypothetical protein